MNKVILIGRLTKDPDFRQGDNSSSARFALAVQRNFKDKDGNYGADFINCVAFGKKAEFISKYFHKGSQIAISGRINTGSYTNKDGQKVYTTDVAVDDAEFVGSKADNTTPANDNPQTQAPADEGFMKIPDNIGDMPFG
jgi:single-strand DNA-binding protein